MSLTHTAIEPVLPEHRILRLEDAAATVLERAARLSSKLREPFRAELAEVTRWMHCYYSNLIEGQQTAVRDIELALRREFAAEPQKRNLQKLALAHLEVQRWAGAHHRSAFAEEFICELHRRFYQLLPEEMRVATTARGDAVPLEPGILRKVDVTVGAHIGPPFELVPDLLRHFRRRYEAPGLSRVRQIVGIGASHHRLAWIHPFRDGNGRVVRLFSDTLIRQQGIDGGGLWSLSRGLSYHRKEYYERLANADQERSSQSADDGRGHLSERALAEFCEFILRVMLDQIDFTERMLEGDGLAGRMELYVRTEGSFGRDAGRIFLLLREALFRGEFPRGEAGRIVGAGERSGRTLLATAIKAGLLKSETAKSPVRLGLPAKVLGYYFPSLFPVGQLGP